MTPPPKDLTDTVEREDGDNSRDAHRARQLLRWEWCEREGPIHKLREELKEQHLQRERSMKKAIVVATFVVTAVTGGIQVWGKLSERQAATNEMAQAMRELRAEVKTLATRNVEPAK